MQPDGSRSLDSLQAGRAFAALAVVCCHAGQFASGFADLPAWLGYLLSKGRLGVDFFFVLSGFIIYRSNRSNVATPGWAGRFAWSRVTRIYIPYLPVGLCFALAYSSYPALAGSQDWNWLSSVTLLPSGSEPALTVAWTLQHEILFYALMLVLLGASQVLAGCVLWLAAIAAAQWLGFGNFPGLALIDTQFAMGIAAAWMVGRFPIPRGDPLIALAGIALCASKLWVPPASGHLVFGGGMALIMLASARLEIAGRLAIPGWLLLLGNASYAIYLVHIPVQRLLARPFGFLDGVPLLVLLIGAGTAAGVAYHLRFELIALRKARAVLTLLR